MQGADFLNMSQTNNCYEAERQRKMEEEAVGASFSTSSNVSFRFLTQSLYVVATMLS